MTAVDRELLEAMLAAFNLHPSQNRLAEAAFAEHRDGFGRAVIAALSGNARSPEAVLTAALKAGAHNQPGAGTFGDAYRLATGKPVPGSDDDPEAWEHEHEFWFYNRYADVLDESGGYAEPNAVYYNALEAERAREAVPGSWVQEIAVRRRRDGDRQTKGS
jgi:hypothetical protein